MPRGASLGAFFVVGSGKAGQYERECAAHAPVAVNEDLASMPLQDGMDKSQAQADPFDLWVALAVQALEGLEQLGLFVLVDTWSVIAHREPPRGITCLDATADGGAGW